ncbi:tail protein X [Vallitalea guaymasensis]|uniref:tail protein X n=1 Tax=Vallitalea guaymasensis TaxID=1185412 RepID=UPI000DE3879C|nr:tail protein X [Vallitalea guaymasensis]
MRKQYITVAGDMWDTIAYKSLGNENYTDKLIKNNLQYQDIIVFPAGIIINIPDAVEQISPLLPPWKRGNL